MGTFHRLFAVLRDRKGNAMLIAAFAMPVLVGASGLATDTIQWTLWKRQLQRQADSAALAGAYAKAQSGNVTTSATAEINRYNLVTLTGSPVIENAPTSGAFMGDTSAVRVSLTTSQTLPFSSFFLSSPPVITAEATARVVASGDYCATALIKTTAVGITFSGNGTVDLGCGMATNSKAANAVDANGSSKIIASPLAAMGGIQSSSNYASGTILQPYSIEQADPFADLPTPVLPSDCKKNGQLSVGPKDDVQISVDSKTGETCYTNMKIQGKLHLNPGIYYIDGGSLDVNSGAEITGDDVTIILTSSTAGTNPSSIGTININGGATVNLTNSDDGTYEGVLFYQDRRALSAQNNGSKYSNIINGNASSLLQGAIYTPSQEVSFSGDSGMSTNCLQLVALTLTFTGNSKISNKCLPESGASSFTGTVVRLVG